MLLREKPDDDFYVLRMVQQRYDRSVPKREIPICPPRFNNRFSWRVCKYRPHYTKNQKILWRLDETLIDRMIETNYQVESTGVCRPALCKWDDSLSYEDRLAYVRGAEKIRRSRYSDCTLRYHETLPVHRAIQDKVLVPMWHVLSTNELFSHYRHGYHEPELVNTSDSYSGENIYEALMKFFENGKYPVWYDTGSYCCVPTVNLPEHLHKIFTLGWQMYGSNSTTGLHNKPYVPGDLSEHEKFRIVRTLVARGWQTK